MQKMLTRVLLSFTLVLLSLGYFHPIAAITQDLGRHLLTGKIIVTTQAVSKENLFSYTYPHFPFINHHWLSEVIFYLVYLLSGFNGLLILTVSVLLVAYGIVVFYAKQENSMWGIVITALLYFPV